jgi:UDP:flavonoid glycosyltransferase YjiC (YdhE family)
MHSPQPDRRNLLCILDWGLGHASRSLALAEVLEAAGETTFFASCGRAKKFLEAERPDIKVYELPAYNVTYPTRFMPLNVALQLPRWISTIWRERRCMERLINELGIDRIISDNRFGCYHPEVTSIFLTHQLHPITHSTLVSSIYRRYLQRFDEFWVPDHLAPEQRISGKLSDPKGYNTVQFIGPLSRLVPATQRKRGFQADPTDQPSPLSTRDAPPGLHFLALLSGPEPMRTQLENILLRQLADLPGPNILVRGLPGGAAPLPGPLPDDLTVYDFANTALLTRLLPAAQHIICRSGYSTLMDVYAITQGEKLILIPTPGQTEQVYLAQREAQRIGSKVVLEQDKLNLRTILK